MTTPPPTQRCDGRSTTPQDERLLESRIAELEAETAELRLAAERARELAAAATAERAADLRSMRVLEEELRGLRQRLDRRATLRSAVRAIRRGGRRRGDG